ncbi:ABC transporter permease [Larkinella sp. C7]|jgi:putative ABC transport system permease protein|uniref:ABC transporter permease n=1 Tax=Larkinella sp. C7 TaxID=2576607 RepID=UPI00111154DC|nr:ABC transporter permease [Larkinella sp. C7]
MRHTETQDSTEGPHPPRWADWLLEHFVAPHLLEDVQGDLHEVFYKQTEHGGLANARRAFVRAVLNYLNPFFLKRKPEAYSKPTNTTMIRNYFKIAFRNLVRNKSYTAINVSGLALGMTCGILIFMLVKYHLSFDTFHANSDRIYRFVTEQHRETISYRANVPSPLGKVFRNDYTFGEKVARIATAEDVVLTVKEDSEIRKFKESEGVAFTEPDFFDIFNYPLLKGDRATVLRDPNTAIVTEKMARKLFGVAYPMNKLFRLDNKVDFRVTGVLKDLPITTDRKTEIYVSYNTLKQYNDWLASDDAWGGINSAMQCFVRLRPGVSPDEVEKVLPAYVKKYRPTNKNVHHYKLQPLADIHFNARYGGVITKTNLWVLGCIGLFLIITACVNFINLATAQALKRSKEVGVRKVLGSFRGQLFWQFIAETGLITTVAVGLACIASALLLPFINDWFKVQIAVNSISDWQFMLFLPLLTLVVTFFAGSYPGLILAGFQPVMALKGKLSQQNIGGFNTRRTLIVGQFAISQVLIIGMIVITNQMRFSTQSDLGFNKDAVVMLPVATESNVLTMKTLKSQFSQIPGVQTVSVCQSAPASNYNVWNTSPRYDNRAEDEAFSVSVKAADEQYIPMFGLKIVAGRNLFPSDTAKEFIVNEMFARKLGLKASDEVIGKALSLNDGNTKGTIVGVIADFHDRSFHEDINAICITTAPDLYASYALKINSATVQPTLAALEKTWSDRHPDQVYDYQFLDEHIANFYATEDLMLKLIQAFAAIAIFIGCLGLYGLVSFMAAQKTKEIGIRKVLGSSMGQILWIFAKEFSRLILIAFVVAAPVAYYTMTAWLKNFIFRVDLGVEIFISAIVGTFLIAFMTVGFKSIKAALMNPVKALRSE